MPGGGNIYYTPPEYTGLGGLAAGLNQLGQGLQQREQRKRQEKREDESDARSAETQRLERLALAMQSALAVGDKAAYGEFASTIVPGQRGIVPVETVEDIQRKHFTEIDGLITEGATPDQIQATQGPLHWLNYLKQQTGSLTPETDVAMAGESLAGQRTQNRLGLLAENSQNTATVAFNRFLQGTEWEGMGEAGYKGFQAKADKTQFDKQMELLDAQTKSTMQNYLRVKMEMDAAASGSGIDTSTVAGQLILTEAKDLLPLTTFRGVTQEQLLAHLVDPSKSPPQVAAAIQDARNARMRDAVTTLFANQAKANEGSKNVLELMLSMSRQGVEFKDETWKNMMYIAANGMVPGIAQLVSVPKIGKDGLDIVLNVNGVTTSGTDVKKMIQDWSTRTPGEPTENGGSALDDAGARKIIEAHVAAGKTLSEVRTIVEATESKTPEIANAKAIYIRNLDKAFVTEQGVVQYGTGSRDAGTAVVPAEAPVVSVGVASLEARLAALEDALAKQQGPASTGGVFRPGTSEALGVTNKARTIRALEKQIAETKKKIAEARK